VVGDFEFWMTAGFLAVALLVLWLGVRHQRQQPAGPPALPRGPGLGGWRVSDAFYRPLDLGVAGFLVFFYAVFPLLARLWLDLDEQEMELGFGELTVNAVVQFLLVALVAGVVASRRRPVEWLGLAWRPVPPIWGGLLIFAMGVVATLATGYFVFALDLIGYQQWLLDRLGYASEEEAMQGVVQAFAEVESPGLLAMLCATAVVVAPVTEEILFRGYLYPVAKRFAGCWPAVIFNALLFSMVHQNAMALLPLAFLALVLVLAYEMTGSIWAPIGIHMVFNATTVFMQIAQKLEWIQLPES
jgi:membrane protease YdiL (CAAX protease family)